MPAITRAVREQHYRTGWNDTMEAFRDLQSREEPTAEYAARMEGIADTRLSEPGMAQSITGPYLRGVLGAVEYFRITGNADRLIDGDSRARDTGGNSA